LITDVTPKNDLVMIGIPLERFLLPDFVESRDAVAASLDHRLVGIMSTLGHRVDRNRDKIVSQFITHSAQPDWLLFMDSDMSYPVTVGLRLLAARKPVIGGLYFHRGTHDPFVMSEYDNTPDKYGRMRRSWVFEREMVYDFLEKSGLPMRDGAVAIDGVEGRIQPCDAIGTGCMLIHRSVLESMEPPWFEYQEMAESEDLTFCWRVGHELDTQVYVDMGTVCGHYKNVPMGHAQFRVNFKSRGVDATAYSPTRAAMWLEEFSGVSDGKSAIGEYTGDKLRELWNSRGNIRDIDFYYGDDVGREYLVDLLRWNGSAMFSGFKNALKGIENSRAIVIGSGIGTIAIQLAAQKNNVVAFEPNAELKNFAKKRWEWTKHTTLHSSHGEITWKGPFRRGGMYDTSLVGSVDLAVAIDVFEHMPEEDLIGAMYYLSIMVKRGGRVFFHNNWAMQDTYPMHHDHSGIWDSIVEEAGFFQMDDRWLLKITGDRPGEEEDHDEQG
jgi:hypothetical protein